MSVFAKKEQSLNIHSEIPLFQPVSNPFGHLLLHHSDIDETSFVAIAQKDGNRWKQFHYRKPELFSGRFLEGWKQGDLYFSMNTFFVPKRGNHYVRQLRALYCDLDFYKNKELQHLKPEWVLYLLQEDVFGRDVPTPSYVILSGRGLQLIYLIEPVPGTVKARRLWKRLQQFLFDSLKNWGADPQVKDESRVFRLAGSINSKTQSLVQIIWLLDKKYTLAELQELWLPRLPFPIYKHDPYKHEPRKNYSKKSATIFSERSLLEKRIEDLQKLVFLRKRKMNGKRELLLWLIRFHLAQLIGEKEKRETVTLEKILEINQLFSNPLSEKEIRQTTISAIRMVNTPQKRKDFPHQGFRFTNQKIIELLEITEEEQQYLDCLIGKSEKNKRKTQKRRDQGIKPRDLYETERKQKKSELLKKLKELLEKQPLLTGKELAELLHVSPSRISQLKKELRKME